MPCPSPEKLRLLVLTGEVEGLEEIEAHLDECEACRRLLVRLESVAAEAPSLLAVEQLQETRTHNDLRARTPKAWDPLIGSDLDGYVLLDRVGSGGSGTVYRAIQPTTERAVAVKLMSGELVDARRQSDEGVNAWKREARLAGRIKHPHVVQILAAGEFQGREYCVFEWIEGGSLADRLRQSQLEVRQAAVFAHQIAVGCVALHEKRILHRDIKPSNVLIDTEGRAKLADFGVARSLDETITTATGAMIGTPGYMSPEQLGTIQHCVDERTDIYGIGATLYAMLVGRGPFPGSSTIEIVTNAAKDDILPPSFQRTVPKDLETICLKCLSREPHDRYANTAALADDLQRFLRGELILARRPPLIHRMKQAVRRQMLLVSISASVVLATLLFAAVSTWINYQEANSLAAMRLQNVLLCKPAEYATSLKEFQSSASFAIDKALASANLQTRTGSEVQQLRLAMAGNLEPSRLVQMVVDQADRIPAEEFPTLCQTLVNDDRELEPLVAETCRAALVNTADESLLKIATVLASTSPDSLDDSEVLQVAQAVKKTRGVDSEIWTAGLLPIGDRVVNQIVQLLEQESINDAADEELIRFAWDVIKLKAAIENNPSINDSVRQLSRLLLLAGPRQISSLVHELPEGVDGSQIVEVLRTEAETHLSEYDPIQPFLPESLAALEPYIEQYQGFYGDDVVLLPAVPLESWPELDELRDQMQLQVIGFRPAVVGGELLAAVTLQHGDVQPAQLSIDIPESEVKELADRFAGEGWYPSSIWARAVDVQDLTKLLVSIVWQQSEFPQRIRFDETLEDWGIPEQLHQENYHEANQYTTVRLGVVEDVEATAELATQLNRERLEIYPTNKFQRSVSIVRDRSAWKRFEASREPYRIQQTVGDMFEHAQLEAIERNFAFTDRVRKLCPGPYPVTDFQMIAEYLGSIGFGPEYVSIAEGANGELLVGSRWSAAFKYYQEAAEQRASRALFTAMLLGDPNLVVRSFNQQLDRTVACRVMSYGEFLDQRSMPAVLRLIEMAESDLAKYSVAVMLGYAKRDQLSAAVVEQLNEWRSDSRNAGLLGALVWLGKAATPAIDLKSEAPAKHGDLLQSDLKHGDLLHGVNGHDFVVLDFQGQPLLTGSQRVGAIEDFASQNVDILTYKFAIGTHEVTRG